MADVPPSFSHDSAQYSMTPAPSQAELGVAQNGFAESAGDSSYVPRPKRIACVVCRRRKLRCDGKRPSCGTCSRLGHECAYDEVRKKSGPKRGYVKQLEARLAQVETLLKGHDSDPVQRTSPPERQENTFTAPFPEEPTLALPDLSALGSDIGSAIPVSHIPDTSNPAQIFYPETPHVPNIPADQHWDLISLGLEEPLPPQDVIDDLDRLFFEKVYPNIPIIHGPRYYASLNLAPHMRPPVCLRYMMWSHAASVSDKYFAMHGHFYQRARKYVYLDEMKGFGESIVSVAHCQTWILIGAYEFRMICFPRAWLSVGNATRLALMMGLNRLDGRGLDVKQTLSPPKDWVEREERRRVFWMAFCNDRYASIGTGWPVVIDECDIMTNLPASEESFLKSKPQRTLRLTDILAGEGVSTLAPYAYVVVLASLFGRNLVHIHRPQPQENDHDLNGEFWKRHRSHDNILLHIALSLPDHLRLPTGMSDINVIFANMSIHTSTICLHQAAIFKAEKNKMPSQIITESKRRCLVAANQISSIMKLICHMELAALNPFMSFCLYIAARVFVQYLKSRPDDSTVQSSLQFVVSALNSMKTKNPLTESFLVQLEVDLEGTVIPGLGNIIKGSSPYYAQAMAMQSCGEDFECGPIYTVRPPHSAGNVASGSSQDRASTGTAHQSPCSGMSTSLPSRHRDPTASFTENTVSYSELQNFNPKPETAGPGTILNVDMDFSPDFGLSDRNNPPSDHPTPSTLNSSSNTSYSMSGADNPSPGQKQKSSLKHPGQGLHTAFDKANLVHPSSPGESSQAPNMSSLSGQLYPNSSSSPLGTTEANSIPTPSTWELPTSNPEMTSMGFSNLNVDSLNEAQWTQILNANGTGNGWGNWRPT
ncbi:hypothetical protein NUU61_007940 [Penicillium alfredii]|uniref:Zn(2)-C6 fungal-type domain-containing protein n=1 Tax=Penicillium alfredii TaxID=1506179 RepID=A0A9W9ERF2_9EURO|nr:uncharacterized protein NUU61_007940 [Penicillium alfredii]KAJ5086633.1 hypothetical protein NUU61_007940 [Penicillium alfredii]